MKKRLLLLTLLVMTVITVTAQTTTVSVHWPLDKTIQGLAAGTTAYKTATAATITCSGTDVSSMLETDVAFGAKWNFQNTITPANFTTKETGLRILRFKSAGASDGSDDYGVLLTVKPTGDLTFAPTTVGMSIAAWTSDGKDAFEAEVRKLNADGATTQTYSLGTIKSHNGVNAQYDDLTFDLPAEVTAGKDAWVLAIRMVKGYNNQIAVGNITLTGTATLGGTVQTSSFTATVSPEGAGTVSPAQTSVVTGDNVTCTATANTGYAFEGWYVGSTLVSTQNPYTFHIIADTQAEACFSKLPEATLTYGVTALSAGMGTVSISGITGNVSFDTQQATFNAGTVVTLTAEAAKGHYFVNWQDGAGNVLSTDAQYTVTLSNDMTVKASFAMIEGYKADLVAFPGAEGFGRFTTGGRMIDGRGAKVYYVTRNDDCPSNALVEGTLRWALNDGDDTPRTVLFRTCGTIYLTSTLAMNCANVTIDGQTAPGGGICIAGYPLKISKPNVIVRYIRFRAGDLPNKSMTSLDVENTHHVILDHCSLTWSMEENLTMYDCDSTTVQWTIISEGLYNSKNDKGARAYATQWGGEHATMHHCLISNVNNRTPRFNGVRNQSNTPGEHDQFVDNEFVNNVIFNWGKPNSIYGGECYKDINDGNSYNRVYMLNNYFRPGPTTQQNVKNSRYFAQGSSTGRGLGQWLLSGNKFETGSKFAPATSVWSDAVLQQVNADNLYGFTTANANRAFDTEDGCSQTIYDQYVLKEQPVSSGLSTTETADAAYARVTQQAGASLPRYDEVDRRLLNEAAGIVDPQFGGRSSAGALERGLGIINSPADITLERSDTFYALDEATGQTVETTMWPWLGMDDNEQLMQDTDLDGLPDDYETANGLNPNDAADGCLLTASGYSNLEVFLNGVADGTIDLTPYKQKKSVEKRNLFSAIVDPTDVAAFKTIGEAVAAAEQNASQDTPYYILVKAGTYQEHVEINKPYIHLTGQGRDQVIITDNKNKDDNGNLGKTATVFVNADDVTLDNLTIRNTYGACKQALALYTLGDRISVTQCSIEGWQDTYRTGKSGQRHLVRECRISGTTDFIYNAGDVFFDSDTLVLTATTNVIVAPSHISPTWGYVFRNAFVTTSVTSPVTTDLGRPWGDTPKVSFIDTRLDEQVSINAAGWRDMSGLPVQMAEYNTVDASGNAVDLSQRKTTFTADGKTCTSKAVLTAVEADAYTLRNVLSGTDQWDADGVGTILPAPTLSIDGDHLSWSDQTGQAVCYLLCVDGKAMLTTDESAAYPAGSVVNIQCVSPNGVLGRLASTDPTVGIRQIQAEQRAITTYDLQGRLLPQPQKGINIQQGKKILSR